MDSRGSWRSSRRVEVWEGGINRGAGRTARAGTSRGVIAVMLRNNGFLFANVQVAIDFTEQSVAHNWEYTVGGSSGLTIQAFELAQQETGKS